MAATLFSVAGCLRCNIVKQFLNTTGCPYRDCDALGDGRDNFKAFYQRNRTAILRGPTGVEFPIFHKNTVVRQGLPMVVAHLMAGTALNDFLRQGLLRGEWVDGLHLSGGGPDNGDKFLDLLAFLKSRKLRIQVDTNGLNAQLLEKAISRGLADRVVMEVKGPLALYDSLLQQNVDSAEIKRSIALTSRCEDYYFYSTITPVVRQQGRDAQITYITPEEIAETARLISVAAGDSSQPYRLIAFNPRTTEDLKLQECEALAKNDLFKYRARARKHQFKTEIISTVAG